jgi:glycosyltransferase involved in cell wall biosynthesis
VRGRLLIDGRPLQGLSATRGIGTYLRGLVGALVRGGLVDGIDLMLAAGEPPPPELAAWGSGEGPHVPRLKRRLQPAADPFLVAALLARRGYRLYHAVEWAEPVAGRTPVVVTVHDLIPFLFKDGYTWMRRERMLALRLLHRAGAVITPSTATARDVVRLAGVDPMRISAIPHGVDARYRPASATVVGAVKARHGIGGDYLLTVGVFDPHKRLPLLLDVLARLRREHPVELVIPGDQGGYTDAVRGAVAAAGLAGSVHLTGYLAIEDLAALYAGSRCLLFTSAYEGFGLPLLEAMACGGPVVAFDNSAIPEVAGDAGVLVRDGDAAAMAEAATTLLGESPERRRRIERGIEWASSFTWERSAAATAEVYRRLAG